jgi:hypothetical protein
MSSIRSQISDALIARIQLVLDVKTIGFDRVKMLEFDFSEWELPAVQIIDGDETNVHEMKRGRKSWPVTIELVIGPKIETQYQPTQKDLWDLVEDIEKSIMQAPKLGLATVIQVKLLGSNTDQGLLNPFYSARINFVIDYYQELVGTC